MKQWIVQQLENSLNRYLALDDESNKRLHLLHNKHVTVELLGMGIAFQLNFAHDKIHLISENFSPADTSIKGTPLTLLRAAIATGDRKHFFTNDATIEGDLEVGQEVIDLFDQLEIDWEECLSRWMGDVSAHQLGQIASRIKTFSRKARSTLIQNINEYTHEEIPLFPPTEALQDFYSDVDELRTDVDRVEARIKLINQTLSKKA